MKKLAFAIVVAASLTGCTSMERGAALGTAGGAAVGMAAGGGSNARNAFVGGAAGAVVGALIGKAAEHPGYCLYQDRNGRVFEARCRRR
ncbi:MAG: hypothetical protein J0H60_08420 [Rhizobiales bacterium]|nr:hypothetical protein [Hyphomicrobiales bacterium]